MTRLSYRLTGNDERIKTVIGNRENNLIRSDGKKRGVLLYGPYISLPAGNYESLIRFDPGSPCQGAATMDVCSGSGANSLASQNIVAEHIREQGMRASIQFSSAEDLPDVEVRLNCESGFVAAIQSVEIVGHSLSPPPGVQISDLPPVPLATTIRGGRSPYDGYRRGLGLAVYDLGAKIMRDPDFQEARELAGQRTIVSSGNLCNIFLLFKFYLPQLPFGNVVEFGSYNGGSAIFMGALARKFLPEAKVVGFDTFAGMPPTDAAVDFHQAGEFNNVDLPELRRYVEQIGLRNVSFVQGTFEDTADAELQEIGPISFCHIDCDIRGAVAHAYDASKPHMVPGGYWVFDDPLQATCLGATEAVEELLIRRDGLNSEQVVPHYVFRKPFDKPAPPVAARVG